MSKATILQLLLKDHYQYYYYLQNKIKVSMETVSNNKPVALQYKNRTFQSRLNAITPINTIVERHKLEEVYSLCDSLLEEEFNIDYIKWYLVRLLSEADSLQTIKQCIPEHLHNRLENIFLTGNKNTDQLFVQDCYDSLEQCVLKNALLKS